MSVILLAECAIMCYLDEHPSINNFIVVNNDNMDRAKDLLNVRVLKKY